MAKIGVIGLGYVGLTTSLGFVTLGHDVVGVESNQNKVSALLTGAVPFFEPGLKESLHEAIAQNKFFATSDPAELASVEFIFICVPTPQDEDGSADLSYVLSAASTIAIHAAKQSVVVTKSTVPVGSAGRVIQKLARPDLAVASNPEFLREGSALSDFLNPDRVVIGAGDPHTIERIASLYEGITAPVIATSLEAAELIKYASNAFLAIKLSFVNDIQALSEKLGANGLDVAAAVGLDKRIGSQFFRPGPGWGGSCFPKDTRALIELSERAGVPMPIVSAALSSNERAHKRVVDKAAELLGGVLEGARIAIWGLSFKANTDDVRDSPAIAVVSRLCDRGAHVTAYDPKASPQLPLELTRVTSALEAASEAELLIVLTEWDEFAQVDPRSVFAKMKYPKFIDTRGILDEKDWNAASLRELENRR
jgi:UDPglucose 6-dehydrogenase